MHHSQSYPDIASDLRRRTTGQRALVVLSLHKSGLTSLAGEAVSNLVMTVSAKERTVDMRRACSCASATQEVPQTEDHPNSPRLTGRSDRWSYGLSLSHGAPLQSGVDFSRLSLFDQASRFGTQCTEPGTSPVGRKGLIIDLTLFGSKWGSAGYTPGVGSYMALVTS